MSSLPRRRRVKRPTIIVKRSQLAKKNQFNKRSYKPLYEKLKANNNALARALSKEKQESQYLFSKNIALTSEVQELGAACNKRDDIISGVLKNAKETLQLMITLSTYVTNTIASCQQVVTTTRFTPRKSNANNRRDSTRRLSGKSPARGVVQPMVSGHTITKPTINLSRLNIQREYRVQNPPNLSDIEEVLTPVQSPAATESTTPVRISVARPLSYATRRVERLPERFQTSMRASDENERRSSVKSTRNSGRHSGRRSRGTSERLSEGPPARRSTSELQVGEHLKSPRVALHDVSRLLQNSQSVNIRTLLESSTSDMDLTHTQQTPDPVSETRKESMGAAKSSEIVAETSEDPETEVSDSAPTPDVTKSKPSRRKSKVASPSGEDDPLEGPSWLLNGTESSSFFSEDEVTTTTVNNSTLNPNAKDQTRRSQSAISEENEEEGEEDEEEEEEEQEEERDQEEEQEEENEEEQEKRKQQSSEAQASSPSSSSSSSPPSSRPVEQAATNLEDRWANPPTNFYQNLNDEDRTTTRNLGRFVTRKRGSVCDDDDDDYTLLWKRPGPPKNYDFDLNDLELPVLESPIVPAVQPRAPAEPEPTTNIQRITQTFGNFAPACPRAHGEETIFDHTGLMLPVIPDNFDLTVAATTSTVVEREEHSDDEGNAPRKRKRVGRRNPIAIADSPSDSDWIPTPKRKTNKVKRKTTKVKDPSSAKVVLQKLNDTHVKKRTPSPENRQSTEARFSTETDRQRQSGTSSIARDDANSDSEGSNASSTAKSVPSRPRRQKAPKNLQEPSLGKKLRRN